MKFKFGGDAYVPLNHSNFGMPNACNQQTFGTFTTDVIVPTGIFGTNRGANDPGRVPLVYDKFTF